MKYTFFLMILFLVTTNIFGQDTKKATYKNDYPSYKETFYVLKENNSVKHGKYTKNIRGNDLVKGQYDMGEKSGVWEFYEPNGDLIHKYDYTKNELVFNKNVEKNEIDRSRQPIALGGMGCIYQMIGQLLRYPSEAKSKGTQGKVFVNFTVGTDGKLTDINVTEGIGDGCREEAVRVFNLINIDWLPGLDKDGNPVPVQITMPITFKLG